MNIRRATSGDAKALCELYTKHLTNTPHSQDQDLGPWREKLHSFEYNNFYHLLIGELDKNIVSSVTLIIIENLTHNLRPYAIIENVVTHADYRCNGYASELMNKASEIAKEYDCYKIMLSTGSKLQSTLNFYHRCGFNSEDKTAFIKWL